MNGKSYPIGAIYGYAVCLIAIVTVLLSVIEIIGSGMDARNPLKSRRYRGPSYASFENYKVDVLADNGESGYVPSDEALQTMFEAAKKEHREIVRYRALGRS